MKSRVYRGADRRRALKGAPGPMTRALESAAVRIGLFVVALLIAVSGVIAPPLALAILGMAVVVCAGTAAAVCLLQWRVARDAPATFLGLGLVLIGVAVGGFVINYAGLVSVDGMVAIRTVGLIAIAGAVLAMLRASRHADVDTALQPWAIVAGLATVLVLAVVGSTTSGFNLEAVRISLRLVAAATS